MLNNLAWLLVNERSPDREEKTEALNAARKAVSLQPDEAHYWGTYATVLVANSMQGEALIAAKKATDLARAQNKPDTIEAMQRILGSSGAE